MPVEPAFLTQLFSQHVSQWFKMAGIVVGISHHSGCKRPLRPIGFLRTLFQSHTQKLIHEVVQSELAASKQAARQHCVENGRGYETGTLSQETQVIVRSMKNQFVLAKELEYGV